MNTTNNHKPFPIIKETANIPIMKNDDCLEYIIYMHLRSFGGAKPPLQKYDALEDKFASFYFNGYGVKKHLRKLRKVELLAFR
jgi:hypothetical protein